jgi:methionine synthase I (cobalamin-dependent)
MYTQAYKDPQRAALLQKLLSEKILILDGAMGTMIQAFELAEADFRGQRFKDHRLSLRGNNSPRIPAGRRGSDRNQYV